MPEEERDQMCQMLLLKGARVGCRLQDLATITGIISIRKSSYDCPAPSLRQDVGQVLYVYPSFNPSSYLHSPLYRHHDTG